jgi:two-component system, NarL family, response regulator LiaR
MSDSIRLLLVDHHRLLRRCLVVVLNRRRGLQVAGEAESGEQARAQASSLQPDVIVVEPEVPGGGDALIADLQREAPESVLLVLTAGMTDVSRRALAAGVRGCIQKDCDPGDVAQAIKRVHAGELVVAPAVVASMVSTASNPGNGTVSAGLTERELDVLRLVTMGRTNPEIALELFITEHTVKGHLANILSKLSLDNRVQLATYALQNGLALPTNIDSPDGPHPV